MFERVAPDGRRGAPRYGVERGGMAFGAAARPARGPYRSGADRSFAPAARGRRRACAARSAIRSAGAGVFPKSLRKAYLPAALRQSLMNSRRFFCCR